MERIPENSWSIGLPAVRLYLEDIEHLRDRIVDTQPDRGVNLFVDRTRFESLEEIKEHYGETISHLTLVGYRIEGTLKPQIVHLQLGHWVSLNVNDDEKVFLAIKDILNAKVRPHTRIYRLAIPFCYAVAIPLLFLGVFGVGRDIFYFPAAIGLMLLAFTIWSAQFVDTFNQCKISLVRRHDAAKNSFLSRNWDKIVLIIIGGIIGSFLTWAVRYFSESPSGPK